MGVLRCLDKPQLVKVENQHDSITYADYIFDDDSDEDPSEVTTTVEENIRHWNGNNRKQKKRNGREQRKLMNADDDSGKTKKNIGSRKSRRLENARLLTTMADPNDICEDFSDLLPSTISAFARLFMEQQNMQVWNEFIEREEAEQRAFLESSVMAIEKSNAELISGGFVLGGRGLGKDKSPKTVNLGDGGRAHHPAYAAEACFRRISRRYQSLLMERRLPWNFIHRSERELIDFFLACPEGVWVGVHPSALHRLLLHAVSEYLSLLCSTAKERNRPDCVTEVRNSRSIFIAPYHGLIEYLSAVRRARNRPPIEI